MHGLYFTMGCDQSWQCATEAAREELERQKKVRGANERSRCCTSQQMQKSLEAPRILESCDSLTAPPLSQFLAPPRIEHPCKHEVFRTQGFRLLEIEEGRLFLNLYKEDMKEAFLVLPHFGAVTKQNRCNIFRRSLDADTFNNNLVVALKHIFREYVAPCRVLDQRRVQRVNVRHGKQ